jgi:hypothetical protein
MPSNDLKEFIIQVLVHLDILVEPKRYSQEQKSIVQSYLGYKQTPSRVSFKGQIFIAVPINLKDKAAGMDDFKSL